LPSELDEQPLEGKYGVHVAEERRFGLEAGSECAQERRDRQIVRDLFVALALLLFAYQSLFAAVFVGYTWWLTRLARRRGLFSPDVALGVLRLGLVVLVGAIVVSCLRSYAEWRVLSTMADEVSRTNALLGFFRLSWSTLIGGFGLLTVGRVMAQSVRMQREIDATV